MSLSFSQSSHRILLVVCAVVFVIPLVSLFGQQNQVQPNRSTPKTIDIVAVVNGEKVSRQQLAQDCLVRFGEQVLENMVYKQLILNACQEKGIVIQQADIQAEVTRMAQKFRITPEAYLQTITQKLGTDTQKYYRDIVWPSLALRRLAADQITIEPTEIRKRMDAKFGPRVQVRMIVLDDEKKATQIQSAVKSNPDDFGKLAKDHSVDPATASMRGMMRPIGLNVLEPEVEQAVFGLKPGEISSIVSLKKQYLIFKCERHYPATQLTDQQAAYYEKQTRTELSEEKLTRVAEKIVLELQDRFRVVNVYNEPDVRSRMPGVAAPIGEQQIQVRDLSEECIARHGKSVLEGEINRILLKQALAEAQVQVTQADIDLEVDQAADRFGFLRKEGGVDREKWLEFVTKQDHVTVELYVEDAVWPEAALKKLVKGQVQVSADDLKKGFEANFGKRVEVLAIVMNSDRQAQHVWKLASQNPDREFFGKLAAEYSVEPGSRENFGQVPPIARHSGRPQLEKQAFNLEPGELSGLINVGQKWIILKCLGFTKPVVIDPKDVEEELQKDILEKKTRVAMNQRFNQIHGSAQIDNFVAGTSQTGVAARIANGFTPVSRNRLPFQQRKP
ncbi:MAG: peptidylprolyl isomerase [Planctomycetota bacterium]|nr:peptidylprolyl isomerase [Planctomycetota bacterium]